MSVCLNHYSNRDSYPHYRAYSSRFQSGRTDANRRPERLQVLWVLIGLTAHLRLGNETPAPIQVKPQTAVDPVYQLTAHQREMLVLLA